MSTDGAEGPTTTAKPSTALAVLAALVPGSLAIGSCLFGAALIADDDGRNPWPAVLATSVPFVVTAALAVVLFFGARGARPKPWVPLLVGVLPMAFGSALVVYGAAAGVAPAIGSSYELRSEVGDLLMARAWSCVGSAVLLAVTGVGLAIAALARRASGRRLGAGCGIGCLSVLPLVALGLYRLVPQLDDVGPEALFPAVVIGAALVAMPLAHAAMGRDADGRSVAFAIASAVALLVAVSATYTAAWWMAASEAVRNVHGDGWRDLVASGEAVGSLRVRALLFAASALVPVALAGIWGWRVRRVGVADSVEGKPGPLAQAAPALVVLALVVFDSVALTVAETIVERARSVPAQDLLLPVDPPSPGRPGRAGAPVVVVGEDETAFVGGGKLPNGALASDRGRQPLVAALRANRPAGSAGRDVDVAVDRSAGGAVLRGLVAAAAESGASALYFSRSSPPPEEATQAVARGIPLGRVFLRPRWEGVRAHLFEAIEPASVDDQPGWHGVVRPGRLRIAPRPDSPVLPFDVFPLEWSAGGAAAPASPPQLLIATRRRPVVRLTIADEATAELVVATVRWLDELGADAALTSAPSR